MRFFLTLLIVCGVVSGAFLLLAVTQALLTLAGIPTEERSRLYLLRLAAFLLILGALWWQNRRGRRSP